MDRWIKWATGLLVLVGMVWTGIWTFDRTYARAASVQAQMGGVQGQIDELKAGNLESERRALRREKFELEYESEQRKLTPLERTRLKDVGDEMRGIEDKIKGLRGK